MPITGELKDPNRLLVDPYEDWVADEGVPVAEGYAVNLLEAETAPWPRFGVDGAVIHLKARSDFTTLFLHKIGPGGSSAPVKHMYEQLVYVLEGHGSTVIEAPDGREITFEWGPRSLFALPLNGRYRHFNGSGKDEAVLGVCNNLPMVMNLFINEDFIFDCDSTFPHRFGPDDYFEGEGRDIPIKGPGLWETGFISDMAAFELKPFKERGPGSSTVQFLMGNGVMKAHCSGMPVGTYKKAHRHGPDYFLFNVCGLGYSLMWYEGDTDFVRVDWKHGTVFSPPDMMFHQHFNTSPDPARYLAMNFGNRRYPFNSVRKQQAGMIGKSVKEGGNQIEYEDQDPRIHRIYLEELHKHGAPCRMNEFMDESVLLDRMAPAAE